MACGWRVACWSLGLVLCLTLLTTTTQAWDVPFKSSKCYQFGLDNLPDRMPINLGNLVALIEKMERQNSYTNPELIADALINRYKVDGITYKSTSNNAVWAQNEQQEIEKQKLLLDKIVPPQQTVPENTFEPREECSLHFMLSHSTDIYPHNGNNLVWEDYQRRRRRNADPRYNLPDGVDPALHPIENGVIWTPYGPVAAGTLLSGIMAADQTTERTVEDILGRNEVEDFPTEMWSKRINPQYATTLAGDLGQTAVAGSELAVSSNRFIGMFGLFANSTAAPKLFTLDRNYEEVVAYLTRAEIFAGIDAMLMQKVLRSSTSSSSRLKLSQLLKMYYSEHGLPGYPQYRACNRMNAYNELNVAIIEEQALNFMYVYGSRWPNIKRIIEENKNDFTTIESTFRGALADALNDYNQFIGSYNYEDFNSCPTYGSKEPMMENLVDLLVVYGREGGTSGMEEQRQYITHLGMAVGVDLMGSRMGILDGKDVEWIVPMTNFTNMADWGSNFTEDDTGSTSSGSDMEKVMAELAAYYTSFYTHLASDLNNASANAQVVLWNVPGSIPNQEEFLELMDEFRLQFPDVYFLLVGRTKGSFGEMLIDPSKDFFTNTAQDQADFAATVAHRISQLATLFAYPGCDTSNTTLQGREQSHTYTGFISPNFTTIIHIAPHYFHYSDKLKLTLTSGDVQVCSSRESMEVQGAADLQCLDSQDYFEYEHLCGQSLKECNPIFLAVTGAPQGSVPNCQDERCQLPNQVEFELRHEGMTCGSGGAAASLLLLSLLSVLHFLRLY